MTIRRESPTKFSAPASTSLGFVLGAVPMSRRSPALLAGLVAGVVLSLAIHQSGKKPPSAPKPEPTPTEVTPPPSSEEEDADPSTELDALAPVVAQTENDASVAARRFHLMPDGSPVPPLSSEAPTRVKLGVALFRYEGAEAPPKATRSKEEALRLAQAAAKTAQSDFAAAVKSADRGSSENLGWIGRGILEPAVEFAVFSTKPGEVSATPVDTPRGYWVVRRIR